MQAFIDEGNGFTRCRARYGIAHATWVKAIRLGDLRVDPTGKPYADARKRYDWGLVQSFYDEGHTYRACAAKFGAPRPGPRPYGAGRSCLACNDFRSNASFGIPPERSSSTA